MNNDLQYNKAGQGKRDSRYAWKRFFLIIIGLIAALLALLAISILYLRWVNPPATAFTLREDWEQLEMERYDLRDYWIPQEELPEHLKWAVVASEDQRFWEHWGLDMLAIDEALEERRRGERQRGASTITQQVAKNLYLSPAESWIRKGVEAGIAVLIELLWPKERILEVYLNIAEFGPGLFGVGKAAAEIFGVAPNQLEPDASARLAAVLPSPKRMRVDPPSPYAEERSQWILRQMTHLSGIPYLPEIDLDTLDTIEDADPLPWDFDPDTIRLDPVEPPQAGEDTILWDDIPDSLLFLENGMEQ